MMFPSVRRALRMMFRSVARPIRRFRAHLLKFSFTRLAVADAAAEWQPDVIHAHDLITLPAAVETARGLGARVIYDAHELEQHRSNPGPLWARLWTRHHEHKYAPLADRVVTVSDSIANHLEAELNVQRPLVVFNSPTVMSDKPGHRDVRGDLSLPDNAPLVIYVGKLTTNRGLEMVVEALARADEIHFVCVGPRVPIVEQSVRDLAQTLNVQGRLHILDPVPPDSIVPYIRTADLSVIPTQDASLSYRYSMPNKLFESVFAGLPVVVSDLPDMRRFVERTGTGIVMKQADPKDIARALREAYARRADFALSPERMCKIVGDYGWDTQGQKLIALYDSLPRRKPDVKAG